MSPKDDPPSTHKVIPIKHMDLQDPEAESSPPRPRPLHRDPDDPSVARPFIATAPPAPDPLEPPSKDRIPTTKGVGRWQENTLLLGESSSPLQNPSQEEPTLLVGPRERKTVLAKPAPRLEENLPTLVAARPWRLPPAPEEAPQLLQEEKQEAPLPEEAVSLWPEERSNDGREASPGQIPAPPEYPTTASPAPEGSPWSSSTPPEVKASEDPTTEKMPPRSFEPEPGAEFEKKTFSFLLSGHGDLLESGPQPIPTVPTEREAPPILPVDEPQTIKDAGPALVTPKAPSGAASVAMLGPPGVGKTYYCKGLVQLFLRPDRLGLHVENLTAVIRRGERSLPLEGYLERFKMGSREAPTPPAHGLNLHELVVDWGKKNEKGREEGIGRASILLNDTAGEVFRNLDENAELQHYVSCSETIWLLLPAWVLARCEAEVRGQIRSYRRAVRDFTDEVDWMYDHPDRMTGKRRFTMVWTMGNDPVVRAWAKEVGLYQSWLKSGKALRDRLPFAMAHFVAFQRRLNRFLDAYISSIPELDLLHHGISRLRKLGVVRHAIVNVIDDLVIEGQALPGGQETQENLLHVEAPVLALLSRSLAFGV